MNNNNPSLDLIDFVETQILPRYADFDRAHGMEHVTRVVRRSLALAKTTGADINMAYVVAAYHDLGLSGPRAVHHLTSGKILMQDARLKRWFSPDQLYREVLHLIDTPCGLTYCRIGLRKNLIQTLSLRQTLLKLRGLRL